MFCETTSEMQLVQIKYCRHATTVVGIIIVVINVTILLQKVIFKLLVVI
jgi:hypothetical protein